ncbi:MAG: ATP synthase F1 subunit delta [Rhodospirillales bacterium]|nr:ATP synthase F1 subunit delta [Rhodospirillales bacterium]
MGSQKSDTGLVATRYAAALIDVAEKDGVLAKVEKDMAELAAMAESSDSLQSVIRNPLIGGRQQKDALMLLAQSAKFQKQTTNFLGMIADNSRLPILGAVIKAFSAEVTRRRGEIRAQVQTASLLSAAQEKALGAELGKATGANVTLDITVNEDLLGGMIVTVGSLMIDDSVRNKLDRLGRAMKTQTNENQQMKEVG